MSSAAYDLVVIGGGTAGLVTAFAAAGLGARVALAERDRLGGECLNTGCVPSKALIASARAVRAVRRAGALGIGAGPPVVDFTAVMDRMRARRAHLARHDSAERLRGAGVTVYAGDAAFEDRRHVRVAGEVLRFRRAVIATGSSPAVPPVPGLAAAPHFTNETVFEIGSLPARLLVIGAGPVGCELAQAFALFGSDVTLADIADRPLPREDPDASAIVRRSLEGDGVRFVLGAPVAAVDASIADAILVATGRLPRVSGMGLDAAGVQHGPDGVVVNDRMQTTNRRIFAAGDVASPYKFTHAADAAARLVVQNALFFGRRRASALVIPWCTYTAPEVARVGGIDEEAVTIPLREIDRAVLDDDEEGFVRVYHRRGRMRGCTVVAPHAGEIIGHAAHLLRGRGTLGALSAAIFPYPTYAEGLRKAGDAWRRSLLTPRLKWLLRKYFGA